MEDSERLIIEEAPPDDSTYYDAEPVYKEKPKDAQWIGGADTKEDGTNE